MGEGLSKTHNLHCQTHLNLGLSPPHWWGGALRIKIYGFSIRTRLDMSVMGVTILFVGFLTW